MRKFYLITTTFISIFLSVAGILIIFNLNARIADYIEGQNHVVWEDVNALEKGPDIGNAINSAGINSAENNTASRAFEYNLFAGMESISTLINNNTNTKIMLIVSYLQKQIKTVTINDLSKNTSNIQFVSKEDLK